MPAMTANPHPVENPFVRRVGSIAKRISSPDKKPAAKSGGLQATKVTAQCAFARSSLLPRTLLVAIRLQALPALVLVHF